MQELSEAGDDEQRVVDSHTDSDHRDEDRGDRVDVGQPGEDEQKDERRSDGDDRKGDRNRGRHERAKDDHQHDERRDEAEQLLNSLLDRRGLGVAVELGGDVRRGDSVPDSVLDGDDLWAIRGLDRLRELRLRIGDAAVLRERLFAERVADAVDPRLAVGGGELGRLELRDRVFDGGLARGRVQALALGCGEDEVQHGALLGRELRFDEVGGLLRVRARNLELVLEAAADRGDEDDERGEDAEPCENDPPGVRGERPHHVRERSRREPFVCGQSVGFASGRVLRHGSSPLIRFRFRSDRLRL